jgi:soluble lytic murein transglycosylase-like protein
MIRTARLATILLIVTAAPAFALDQRASLNDSNGSNLEMLISRHAAANGVPEELVRRVIKRESRGNPRAVNAGNYGLMQIRLGTARAMGYTGSAAGLLDADTNMTYAVKYLAGAYRVSGGNMNRAVGYYAAGYYYAAKSKGGLEAVTGGANAYASAWPNAAANATPVNLQEKVRVAQAGGQSVSSSSDLFSGKLDYH